MRRSSLGAARLWGLGAGLQRRGFTKVGTKLRARNSKENQDQHFRWHGSTALARSIRGRSSKTRPGQAMDFSGDSRRIFHLSEIRYLASVLFDLKFLAGAGWG